MVSRKKIKKKISNIHCEIEKLQNASLNWLLAKPLNKSTASHNHKGDKMCKKYKSTGSVFCGKKILILLHFTVLKTLSVIINSSQILADDVWKYGKQ